MLYARTRGMHAPHSCLYLFSNLVPFRHSCPHSCCENARLRSYRPPFSQAERKWGKGWSRLTSASRFAQKVYDTFCSVFTYVDTTTKFDCGDTPLYLRFRFTDQIRVIQRLKLHPPTRLEPRLDRDWTEIGRECRVSPAPVVSPCRIQPTPIMATRELGVCRTFLAAPAIHCSETAMESKKLRLERKAMWDPVHSRTTCARLAESECVPRKINLCCNNLFMICKTVGS